MRAVCDGLERCCGVRVLCGIYGIGCVRGGVSCVLVILFECLELTRAFAVTHVCDCGIAWRLMVLGGQPYRAGAWAFRKGA